MPSRLFSLEPQGLGSLRVESLASYVRRLAHGHVVSPATLLREMVLLPAGKADDPASVTDAVSGATQVTKVAVSKLAELTGVAEVALCTLLPLEKAMFLRRSFSATRRWCRACLRQDEEPYDRLLWGIRAVRSCWLHGYELEDRCARCTLPHKPLHSRATPTLCPHCGWRLENGSVKRAGSEPYREALAELILLIQRGAPLTLEAIRHGIGAAAARRGGMTSLAGAAGVSLSTVKFLLKSHRPELSTFLKILTASGEDLDSFLRHEPRAPRRARFAMPSGWSRPSPKVEQIRIAVEVALAKRDEQRPTIRALARERGVSDRFLRHHFPAQIRELGAASKRRRQAAKRAREARLTLSISEAVTALVQRGVHPTLTRVEKEVGISGLFLSKEFRAIAVAACSQAAAVVHDQ